MADQSLLETLHDTAPTPIAQLKPASSDEVRPCVVDGVVTITWPYSIISKSIAFILAEQDVLLRRNQGQVRIEFHGASGKAIADANIGGGDQLRISLDGAQWTKTGAKAGLPSGSLEWQLKFNSRLLLNIRRVDSESQKTDVIDIHTPEEDLNGTQECTSNTRITPPVESIDTEYNEVDAKPSPKLSATTPSKRLASKILDLEEYASPAFLKRARVSYGSLFEGGLGLFDDGKGEQRKKRKRKSRFSMGNTTWRYSSRSPSPEATEQSEPESPEDREDRLSEKANGIVHTTTASQAPNLSAMVDEGCQTQGLDDISPSININISSETHIPRFALPASPSQAAEHSTQVHTPSRNLFEHVRTEPILPGATTEPIEPQPASVQHHHHLGLELSNAHEDNGANLFGVAPPPHELMTSMDPPHGAIAGFPESGTTDHVYSEHVLHHDPNLHFHNNHYAENQIFHGVVSHGNLPWHPETALSTYPPIPDGPHQAILNTERSHPQESTDSTTDQLRSTTRQVADQVTSPVKEVGSSANREEQSVSEDDGGDIQGEDYDLRNYDKARDDDQSASEGESEEVGSNVEEQAAELDEQGNYGSVDQIRREEEDEEEENDEEDEDEREEEEHEDYGGARHRLRKTQRFGSEDEELTGSVDDESALNEEDEEQYENSEGYDDENEYSDEEEEEDEEDEEKNASPWRPPSAPKEPVFISLLSDSEDEEEPVQEEDEHADDMPSPESPEHRSQGQTMPREDGDEEATTKATKQEEPEEGKGEAAESQSGAEEHVDESMEDEPVEPAATETEKPDAVAAADVREGRDIAAESAKADDEEHPMKQGLVADDVSHDEPMNDENAEEMTAAEADEEKTSLPVQQHGDVSNTGQNTTEGKQPPQLPDENVDIDMADTIAASPSTQLVAQLEEPDKTKLSKKASTTMQSQTQETDGSKASEELIMNEDEKNETIVEENQPGDPDGVVTELKAPQESQESDVLITVKSLRSHSHRKTRSCDSTGSRHDDPSLLLALSSVPERATQTPERDIEHTPAKEPTSPRTLRSTRQKSEQADPSILLARAAQESPKAVEESPSVRVTRSMTEHMDELPGKTSPKAASPVGTRISKRLATPESRNHSHKDDKDVENAAQSPSVAGSVIEDESVVMLKRHLLMDLANKLPDYLPLSSLRTSLNRTADILAVATSTPPQPHRPRHGPRDYMLELILTDPSAAPSTVNIAHIYRPHQASLPTIQAGDVVLLRRVHVVSMKGQGFGVRVGDESAWAVFEKGDEEMLPQIRGPPVEVVDDEVEYAMGLRRWWTAMDDKMLAKITKVTQKVLQAHERQE